MNLITPDFGTIFWQTITFIVVMIILKKFAWKTILTTIQAREQKIQGAIESANEAKKQLELLQEKGKEILDKANLESEYIIKEAISIRDQIVRESKSEAKTAGDSIINKAKNSIEKEKKLAIMEIKNNIAELIINATEKILNKKLKNDEENQKLLEEILTSNNFKNDSNE